MLVRNPFFTKIRLAESEEAAASYGGITWKSLWFWLLCFGGAEAYFLMPLTMGTAMLLAGGLVAAVICPLLSYWFPLATSVTGSLYSAVQGFLLALVCQNYAKEYGGLIWLAAAATALVCITMLALYTGGVVKVNHRFRDVLLTLFLVSVIGSAVVLASSFFTTALTDLLWENGAISIAVTVGALLLAAVNLVFECDFAKRLVKDGACKKYEWVAAYGIFMTIIIIFIRMLELFEKLRPEKQK